MTDSAPSLREQLLRAAQGSVLLRVVSLTAAMATSVVLARALGPTAFGIYAYVFAIVTLLALPSEFGIPILVVRETARAHAGERWSELKGLWAWATRVILLTSVAIAVVAIVIILTRGNRIGSQLYWTLIAGLGLVPMIALGNARGAALRGLRLIVRGQLPETVIRPVLLLVFIVTVWRLGGPVSAADAMAWHVLAAAIAFAIGAAILWQARPAGIAAAASDASRSREWWHAALPLGLITGLQMAGNQSGVVLLGLFRPEAEAGLYKVAASIATLALFGLETANLVVAPHIARMHAQGDHKRLQRLASVGALVSGALTLPVFLAFVVIGRWLIGLLYGASYVEAYWPLLILGAGQMVNALFGFNAGLLSMTGHERSAARWLAVSAGSNILLGALAIPRWGMVGAATAQVIAQMIWNVAFWRIAKHKVGIDSGFVAAVEFELLGNRKFNRRNGLVCDPRDEKRN
jgi:O-antigen/teichoic acid export membrane protein